MEKETIAQRFGTPKQSKRVRMKFIAAMSLVTLLCVASPMPVAVAQTGVQALVLAERMAKTSINLWRITGPAKDKFQYELGVFLRGIELVWEQTRNPRYFNYIKFKVDRFVNADGSINSYNLNDFALDSILTGRLVLTVYQQTGAAKYKKAADLLREQLRRQPRTKEGGFWHKAVYPYQMWLDGSYMAEPFYAQYARNFHEPQDYNDIAAQFIIMEERTRDPVTGLLDHGYDESRVQHWSNPATGRSPSVWGRGDGWYAMALVDTLDFFPLNHPRRPQLLAILSRLAAALENVQDPASGLWWQVLDKSGDRGNYLESSASAMFVYAIAKGVRRGYLPLHYRQIALKGYNGIVSHFVQGAAGGGVTYTGTVSVGGLGGSPYRDGSYAYYLSEPVVSNDPKGVGPFMMASVEISRVF